MAVAWHLLNSVIAFTLYAFLPFIDIDRKLDFEATMDFINARNQWLENIKKNRWLDASLTTVQDQIHYENHSFSRQ